jgi:cystathionine beta-lyase
MLQEMNKIGYDNMNLFGLIAAQTAYAAGETWLRELKSYLAGNLEFTREFLRKRLPQIKLVEPEGTYLLWLDCTELGYDDEKLNHLILNKAKLWLDAGSIFGREGEGFERINIATSRTVLEKALLALENAVKSSYNLQMD